MTRIIFIISSIVLYICIDIILLDDRNNGNYLWIALANTNFIFSDFRIMLR